MRVSRFLGKLLGAGLLLPALAAACSDPVHDTAISALGDENPNIPVGEYHRAGQPCVTCHTASGPASSYPFALGGTVFAIAGPAVGVENAYVAMTDTLGSSYIAKTNCVGNWYVTKAQWDPAFPIFVRVYKDGLSRTMQGQIGRERSCANCHKDSRATSLAKYSSVGHVYLYTSDVPAPASCPVNPTAGAK
jgi:hypothetical protein